MADYTGKTLGNWQLQSLLGEGAFGAVYLAINPVIGQEAAVKVLHQEKATRDIRRRFFAEARAASQARLTDDDSRPHPGVVQIFDGDDGSRSGDGICYIVMERLQGITLHQHLVQNGPLSPLTAAHLGEVLADTLLAVHRRKVIHRDLKPENIFLQRADTRRPKILDFGIAKLREGNLGTRSGTVPGTVMGTPQYMSPEQGQGLEDIDERADVYSLGIILFECLHARVPFDGPNYQNILFQHLSAQIPALHAGVPASFAGLVIEMLAKQSERRPSIEEVRDRLRTIAGQEASSPTPQPQGPSGMAGSAVPVRGALDSVNPISVKTTTFQGRPGSRVLWATFALVLVLVPSIAYLLVRSRNDNPERSAGKPASLQAAPTKTAGKPTLQAPPSGYIHSTNNPHLALSKTKVTIGEFHRFVDAKGIVRKTKWPWQYSKPLPGELVMNNVTKEQAQGYCVYAASGRLPTRADLAGLPAAISASASAEDRKFADMVADEEPKGPMGFRCAVDLKEQDAP